MTFAKKTTIGIIWNFTEQIAKKGIGDRCFFGAASVVSSNIRLSEGIIVGAGAVVVTQFDEGDIVIAGVPAKMKGPVSTHKGVPRNTAYIKK